MLPYVKERVDRDRGRPGQYLLTGSQNLLLHQRVTEPLAGRVAVLRLLPFSAGEAAGRPRAPLPWEGGASRRRREAPSVTALWKALLHGHGDGFWRIAAGGEVDLVVEEAGKLVPVEAKASATPGPAMAEGVAAFRRDLGTRAGPGFVVHAGGQALPLAPGVTALPFAWL
jgi:predicted AAA+ superfamily ATPase